MNDEVVSKKQEEVKPSEQVEAFLRYLELLHQINLKQKIVKLPTYEKVEDIGSTDTSSETK